MKHPHLVVIAGPTGVGKSALAVELAKAWNTDVISADAFQIYRGLDIGTGKITREEMQGVPHHMVDILDPSSPYSVKQYRDDTDILLSKLSKEKNHIIVCGGTGLYVQSLLYALDLEGEGRDEAIRRELVELWRKNGATSIREMLSQEDPESYAFLHENDMHRNIRALEYVRVTGKSIRSKTQHFRKQRNDRRFSLWVLDLPREVLYRRIEQRVDHMINAGFFDEVRSLLASGVATDAQSMRAIGYPEAIAYFQGHVDRQWAIDKMKQHTKNYAKRQWTWYRSNPDAHFVPADSLDIRDMMMAYDEKGEHCE